MAARAPRPEDLYDLRVPIQLDISPDGRQVAFAVKSVAPGKDGYRTSLWIAPADGSGPARQLTVGSKSDTTPRWSPDGRSLAFLSDRGAVLQAGGGSGDSLFGAVRAAGVDAFLTADLRHHPVSEATQQSPLGLVDAAHWATEWPWCEQAAAQLDEISDRHGWGLRVHVSRTVTDPWSSHHSSSGAPN